MENNIKNVLFDYIIKNNGEVNFEDITKKILLCFPNSLWKKTHWAWYKTQITSPKGKYFNLFSEEIKNKLTNGKVKYLRNNNSSTSIIKKNNPKKSIHPFENYSKSVEKEIAIALGKVCHHIHPKIIKKITEANKQFKLEFENLPVEINSDIFFYEGSDCVFPGVRRHINKEKIGNWKNNICNSDNMILNDNTFPRHIWTFLSMNRQYDANSWKESGLEQFELAHIFGHKTDEKMLEEKVFRDYNTEKLPFGLFTSASNVVLIPNGLMKPTDKFESIKIVFYKRHIELYGNNLYSEKELLEELVPSWYSEINWLEPQLPDNWEEKIENLLSYRQKVLTAKYTASR